MKICRTYPVIKCVVLFSTLILFISCSATNENISKRSYTKPKVEPTKIVTLDKKPTWLLVAGIDIKKPGGDRMVIGGKKLELPGWNFLFENFDPKNDPLVVTPSTRNQVIYWKGKGSITNTAINEKISLPLPTSEDPRTSEERKQYFDDNL